jgi:hypothetical protein
MLEYHHKNTAENGVRIYSMQYNSYR